MPRLVRWLPLFLLVSACGGSERVPVALPGPSSAQSVAAPTTISPPAESIPERLASDTPERTPAGATFTAPAGWTMRRQGELQLLEGPEAGVSLAIVESKSGRPDEAISEAWASFRPGFAYPAKTALDGPARGGWDAKRSYEYDIPQAASVRAYAVALRKNDTLTMVLVHADLALHDRRRGQLYVVLDSLRPRGYERESFRGKVANPLDGTRVARLTEFVEHHREPAGVPGVALAIVEKDKVVFEGGFGIREVGRAERVGANTLFMIGSISKSLTTLLLAKLVDEGKFDWETPVTAVYPSFKLGDETTTSQVHMKHLVCACTGFPREGFEAMLEFERTTAKDKIAFVGTMQPTTKIGEAYQYSNVLGAVAGFIGAHAVYPARELGAAYDEAIRTRVFEPLGMKRSTVDTARVLQTDHASPHAETFAGKTAKVTVDLNRAVTRENPSGGIWSTAHDMAAYLRMELAEGKLQDGRRYLSKENLVARRTPQVTTGEDQAYGMGFMIDRQSGTTIVQHAGSTFGFKSMMFFLPEHGVGVAMIANADNGQVLMRALLRKTLEVLFDGRSEADEDLASRLRQRGERTAKERARWTFPADAAAKSKLARRYLHPSLGEIRVTTGDKGANFDFGEWKSAVASRKEEGGATAFLPVDTGAPDFMEFVADEREGKRVLVLRDMQRENVFVEVH